MRIILAIFLLASARAQVHIPDAMVQHFCGAPQLTSGAEFTEVAFISQRLSIENHRIHIAVANSPVVNAWELDLSPEASLICVPVALVHLLGDTEGQLAFILAHEMAHATDERCKVASERAKIAGHLRSGAAISILFGRSNGQEAGDQRACESRADEFGLDLITRAGYHPRDATAALGKLSSYFGNTGTGPIAHLAALGNDHPITSDRINHLLKRIRSQTPHFCHPDRQAPGCPHNDGLSERGGARQRLGADDVIDYSRERIEDKLSG